MFKSETLCTYYCYILWMDQQIVYCEASYMIQTCFYTIHDNFPTTTIMTKGMDIDLTKITSIIQY